MKKWTQLFLILQLAMFGYSVSFADTPMSKATTSEKQAKLTPDRALQILKEGNQRFLNNKMRDYDFSKDMKVTSLEGQHPVAIILNCIDSRSIPDILFDQGLGNIFVTRVAGNVADKDILGGMEFATKLAGTPLVVVMGHTRCGAVRGACQTKAQTGMENLDILLSKILPAVKTVQNDNKEASCSKVDTVDAMAKQNVINQMDYIVQNSQSISNMLKDKNIQLIGAMHQIKTGKVEFFDIDGKTL